MNNTFSIKKTSDFSYVYKKGKCYSGRFLVLYALKNHNCKDLLVNYIGITASKKTGKSVKRNRLKRLVRENYRAYESFIPTGYYLIFIIRSVQETPDFKVYQREMKYLFKKANVFDFEKWSQRAKNDKSDSSKPY